MPTTIDSAGITFNDTTSLTSANIGTAQLANGSVTAAKLGTNEQKQIAKAWVNFNGEKTGGSANASSANTISCNSGSSTGTWTATGFVSNDVGTIYKITQVNGVSGATFGGVDVSTLGIQIISTTLISATFRFLSGTTTSAQSVTGTGSSASGFSFTSTGIRSSYNVSSVTKNGTGDYTVNFTTALADANYAISLARTGGSNGIGSVEYGPTDPTWRTANKIRFVTTNLVVNANVDEAYVNTIIFGN